MTRDPGRRREHYGCQGSYRINHSYSLPLASPTQESYIGTKLAPPSAARG